MKNLHSPSPVQVLQVLSDCTSVDIMNAVAENVSNSANIRELLGLTYRQYVYQTFQAPEDRDN